MTHEQVKKEVAALFEKTTDPEVIKQVAVVTSHIDELSADEVKLEKANNDLASELKKAVLNGSYKPEKTAEESGAAKPAVPSFEQAAEDFAKKVAASKAGKD